jgi:hypothetical protein
MVLKSKENSVGAWSFLVGVILAVIIGVSTPSFLPISTVEEYSRQIYGILVLLGVVVGSTIKIEGKDSQTFLLAGAVLVVVSKFGMESVTGSLIGIGIGNTVVSTFSALLSMFVPATIIVSIKTVFSLAKI